MACITWCRSARPFLVGLCRPISSPLLRWWDSQIVLRTGVPPGMACPGSSCIWHIMNFSSMGKFWSHPWMTNSPKNRRLEQSACRSLSLVSVRVCLTHSGSRSNTCLLTKFMVHLESIKNWTARPSIIEVRAVQFLIDSGFYQELDYSA